MVTKDYYFILGVHRDESAQGIKKAYRKLARRYHPDRAGTRWTVKFQELNEAYEVLSSPEKRRQYNRGLQHAEGFPLRRRQPVVTSPGIRPEPLTPSPASPVRHFVEDLNAPEGFFPRFAHHFTPVGSTGSEIPQAIEIEIVLTPEEAIRGGRIPIEVPSVYPCAYCHGTGLEGVFKCWACHGRGLAVEREMVFLTVPAMVAEGSMLIANLQGMGIHDLYLQARVRIDW